MRLDRFAAENARPLEAHGSTGLSISPPASSLRASLLIAIVIEARGLGVLAGS